MRSFGVVKKIQRAIHFCFRKASQPFYSRRATRRVAQTWQVLRSEFDLMLMEKCPRQGRAGARGNDGGRADPGTGAAPSGVKARSKSGQPPRIPRAHDGGLLWRDALAPTRLKLAWCASPSLIRWRVDLPTAGRCATRASTAGQTTVAYVPEEGLVLVHPATPDMISVEVVG